jgi:23S rRNA U2552 (ribose-2'-O)-methylase RlmE/FtsJ
VDPGTTCEDVRARAERKLADIEDKMQALERIKGALQQTAAIGCSMQRTRADE